MSSPIEPIQQKVRLWHGGPLEEDVPPIIQGTINAYHSLTKQVSGQARSFVVDDTPMSLNNQYSGEGRSKHLRKQQLDFRQLLSLQMPASIKNWKPDGVLAAVIIFMSPCWVTQELRVRKHDLDNKIKPVLDAIQLATGIQDERFWSVTAHKLHSKRNKTIVTLFSLGDIVHHSR